MEEVYGFHAPLSVLVPTQALKASELLEKPFALFGHSMGAVVVYELAQKLAKDFGRIPKVVIVSGCRPPKVGPIVPLE